jgi:mRNA-degrading endonuclease RelE of RelBE toxin-antitoxin system
MSSSHYYSERIAAFLDGLSSEERVLTKCALETGFDDQAAQELFKEGVAEQTQFGTSRDETWQPDLLFVPSALRDLRCFVDESVKGKLRQALSNLPSSHGTRACRRIVGEDGWVLNEGPFRIVYDVDDASRSFVVFGIACWACNPMLKVWRYLDQSKAEDLVRTGELYFRRLDLLEDKYEATPTLAHYLDYEAARKRVFPADSPTGDTLFDGRKLSAFACCWRMSPHESWLMWKQYCQKNGGFAIQTTWRKLGHLHALLRQSHDVYCRLVSYIRHRVDAPRTGGLGDECFYKAVWFSDEREIRLVRFRDDYFHVTQEALEANPRLIPECYRIRCDLLAFVEGIVFNPFTTPRKMMTLTRLMERHRPALQSLIRPSEILELPVGAR